MKRAWQMLRALRQSPPGLAARDAGRRELFSAAMEQSEQFFRAAAEAAPKTRALLLFYGLAQSGRALRAAQQTEGEWWRDGGHGITVVADSTGGALADCLVWNGTKSLKGHFQQVAAALGRASLPEQTSVGQLARLLWWPGLNLPLNGPDPVDPPLPLELVYDHGPVVTVVEGLRAELTVPRDTWQVELPEIGVRHTADFDRYRDHVRERLRQYPTLAGAQLYEPAPAQFDLGFGGAAYRGRVQLVWPELPAAAGSDDTALHRVSDDAATHVTVCPCGPGSEQAAHRYLLWWAVLFAMAHHVRYEPTAWARLVDVDRSEETVPVEHIGDLALSVLPELIHRTLVRTEPQ